MNVFITGNLNLGSQLYSQCLRDIQRVLKLAGPRAKSVEFSVDDSAGGTLASKLLSGMNLRSQSVTLEFGVQAATLILVYTEDPEDTDAEARVNELMSEFESDAQIEVRTMPKDAPKQVINPEGDPYSHFQRVQSLIRKRIRPIPTRGPQIWREVEIRPNGGRPWFDI